MFFILINYWGWLLAALLLGAAVGWVAFEGEPRGDWFKGWLRWATIAFVVGLAIALLKIFPGRLGLYVETALWLFAVYIVGCFIGGYLRSTRGGGEAIAAGGAAALLDAGQRAVYRTNETTGSVVSATLRVPPAGEQPAALASRPEHVDDLTCIRGIGPGNQTALNGSGVWTYGQIAGWSDQNAIWVANKLGAPGRVHREDWIGQAKLLASGRDTTFSQFVKSGAIKPGADADAALSDADVAMVRADVAAGGVAGSTAAGLMKSGEAVAGTADASLSVSGVEAAAAGKSVADEVVARAANSTSALGLSATDSGSAAARGEQTTSGGTPGASKDGSVEGRGTASAAGAASAAAAAASGAAVGSEAKAATSTGAAGKSSGANTKSDGVDLAGGHGVSDGMGSTGVASSPTGRTEANQNGKLPDGATGAPPAGSAAASPTPDKSTSGLTFAPDSEAASGLSASSPAIGQEAGAPSAGAAGQSSTAQATSGSGDRTAERESVVSARAENATTGVAGAPVELAEANRNGNPIDAATGLSPAQSGGASSGLSSESGSGAAAALAASAGAAMLGRDPGTSSAAAAGKSGSEQAISESDDRTTGREPNVPAGADTASANVAGAPAGLTAAVEDGKSLDAASGAESPGSAATSKAPDPISSGLVAASNSSVTAASSAAIGQDGAQSATSTGSLGASEASAHSASPGVMAQSSAEATHAEMGGTAASAAASHAGATDALAVPSHAAADETAAQQAVSNSGVSELATGKPPSLVARADSSADDLKLIKGIGPKNEAICHDLGVWHFSQIADWTPENVVWVGDHMKFPGRVDREKWIPQAKLLAAGIDTPHSSGVKSGAVVIDDSADAPLSDAEAQALVAELPKEMAAVEGEDKHEGRRPLGLADARANKPDDLKRIKGIGKQNEARLHALGVWHFDQIAAWSEENIKWVGSYLSFPGRIKREDWLNQSRQLSQGAETEFSKRVAAGKVASSKDDGTLGQGNVAKLDPH